MPAPQKQELVIESFSEPWKQFPGEPDTSYGAFFEWLSSGERGQRIDFKSLAQKFGWSMTTVYSSSALWKWKDRARVYDAMIEQQRLTVEADRRTKVIEREYNLAMTILDRLEQTMAQVLKDKSREAEFTAQDISREAGGIQINLQIGFDADTLSKITNTAEVAIKMARRSVGLPATISASSVDINHGIQQKTIDQMIAEREEKLREQGYMLDDPDRAG